MFKKLVISLFVQLLSLFAFSTLEIGDDESFVIAELGPPSGKIKIGQKTVYSYPQGSIHVKSGKIVEISDGFYVSINQVSRSSSGESIELNPGDTDSAQASLNQPELPDSSQIEWFQHYEKASQISQETGKPLLMLFTGSDWCVWCKKLEEQILETSDFISYARENVILLKIDFPQNKPVPEELRLMNEELKELWNVEGYPTIVVLDTDGLELGRTGYLDMTPVDYVRHLHSILAGGPPGDSDLQAFVRGIFGDEMADQIGEIEFLNNGTGGIASLSIKIMMGSIMMLIVMRRFMKR